MTSDAAGAELRKAPGVSRWQQIRDMLAADIAQGRLANGDRLPSEQALAVRFAVHRHTVRQALKALAAAGQVRTEHGRGSFACTEPLRYALGGRTSFTANVTDQGRAAGRCLELLETIRAPAAVATPLDLSRGALVLRALTIATADDVPVAQGAHHFPLSRLAGIEAAIRTTGGISAALAACGVGSFRRARTRISTRPATVEEAVALSMAPQQPVLITEGLDVDPEGVPIQFGITAFCGSRVELDVAT